VAGMEQVAHQINVDPFVMYAAPPMPGTLRRGARR